MHVLRVQHYAPVRLLWLGLAALLMWPLRVKGATEDTFDVFQVGTRTYTNVTVTTKAKTYIFILHAGGMTSIKVAALPPDLQEKLGYASPSAPKPLTNAVALWGKKELAKLNVPDIKSMRKQFEQKWRGQTAARLSALRSISSGLAIAILGVGLLLYLFYCYCLLLICCKAGKPPGLLIWLPLFQLIPLLRAAGMSALWFLAYFVPILNLVPAILWPLRIAKARGKSVWVGVLLLLPLTNLFAFLYLAFSDSVPEDGDEGPEPKIMSLQTV